MNPADLDKKYVWHPFTPNDDWTSPQHQPVMIAAGRGSLLIDSEGREYLDGNSSIWTNLHGHRHPVIDEAVRRQLDKIAHSSYLGLAHEPGALLAEQLVNRCGDLPRRVFFSDDGSTALETALKVVYQYFQQNGQSERKRFVSLAGGYHGDTIGTMSLGHSAGFHRHFSDLLFPTEEVMAPACYRCPFNRACPEKADARTYRQCQWECMEVMRQKLETRPETIAGVVMEPRVQGAAGMLMHPHGYLEKVDAVAKAQKISLILDEVMTGFGRTGAFFAYEHEAVEPDVIALAKGLTGGYSPLAATVFREHFFEGFSGGWERTLFHGHSYTGHQLGCAAALANLQLMQEPATAQRMKQLEAELRSQSQSFWSNRYVGDVRQEGTILAIELVEDFASRRPFAPERRIAFHVSETARKHGLLTRGIGNVLMLMPAYSTTSEQLERMASALRKALEEVLPGGSALI